MKTVKWIVFPTLILCLSLFTVAGATDDVEEKPVPTEWTVPDCAHIAATSYYTYTMDEGLSFVPTPMLRFQSYPFGLAVLDSPNTLLATNIVRDPDINCNVLFRSENAGCRWEEIAQIPVRYALWLEAAPGGQAYAWNRGQAGFFFYDGRDVHERFAPDFLLGFAVNPENAAHIRIGTHYGQLWESFDHGVTYTKLGNPVSEWFSLYAVAFDPVNWDNALCSGRGVYLTTDAGQNWQAVGGIDSQKDVVLNVVYSTADPSYAWVRANREAVPEYENCMMVSTDGGRSFELAFNSDDVAVDQFGITRRAYMTNSPVWAVHPVEPDVLYYIYGDRRDDYGTDFFRYDQSSDELSVTHTDALDGIGSIAFNPVDAKVMYVGLMQEIIRSPDADVAKDAARVGNTSITSKVSPNPFNPSANISFNLPSAAQVRLEIFNVMGHKVSTLVDSHLGAGEHVYSWDGSRFASGVYLYRLQVGQTVRSEKMLLLK